MTARMRDHTDPTFPGRTPTEDEIAGSQLADFARAFSSETGQSYVSYSDFERAAIEKSDTFWEVLLKWCGLPYDGPATNVRTPGGPDRCIFFPEIRLNFAQCLLDGVANAAAAVVHCDAEGDAKRTTGKDLRRNSEAIARHLQNSGIKQGDVVIAVARNNLDVIVACIATAAIGAVFSVCSADMPLAAIHARFAPLRPKVLFATSQSQVGDAGEPLAKKLTGLIEGIETLQQAILFDRSDFDFSETNVETFCFQALLAGADGTPFRYERFPFNQPLFVLFSSGTTGPPKRIVHGAGGTLLEHVKEHRLHCDFRPGERLFFQTSCSWMMWNWQLSALASGTEIVVYDGPVQSTTAMWTLVADQEVSIYGTNPAFLQICENDGYIPKANLSFSRLRSILTTGSVLREHQFDWLWHNVKDIPVASISGGTDIIGCFVLGSPVLPVRRGEIQCRSLAMDVRAVVSETRTARSGDLICGNAFPSRPLGFWGDKNGEAFRAAYFEENAGVWTHGDLIEFLEDGGIKLHGRSDGVLNIGGIRIGPAEIYEALAGVPEIQEAAAVERADIAVPGGARLALLVVLRGQMALDPELRKRLRVALARRVPAAVYLLDVFAVSALPKTFSGKTSDSAARDAVNGKTPENVLALHNPECILALQNLYPQTSQGPPR